MTKKQKQNIFKLHGSYLGLFVGFIVALQFKVNRMYILEGIREFECAWKPVKGSDCSDWVLLGIIILLLVSFFIGGYFHKRIIK